ncbi:MAG: molybdenum cofactor biosynthesis protein MoaE [Agriterribacter sp.]
MIDVKISDSPLDIAACIAEAGDPGCGGLAVFIGNVRNKTNEKKVIRLEYECYHSMALKEMRKIAEAATQLYTVENIVMHHRIGTLYAGDSAVVIVAAAPHRQAAFDACKYAIDTLKKAVPVWKKEIFEDGAEWVSPHP